MKIMDNKCNNDNVMKIMINNNNNNVKIMWRNINVMK